MRTSSLLNGLVDSRMLWCTTTTRPAHGCENMGLRDQAAIDACIEEAGARRKAAASHSCGLHIVSILKRKQLLTCGAFPGLFVRTHIRSQGLWPRNGGIMCAPWVDTVVRFASLTAQRILPHATAASLRPEAATIS